MLHCKPTCEYSTDDEGKQHFRRVLLKIWDDRDYFDPAAVRRSEKYDDIDQAIDRLDEFNDEPSFDMKSRLTLSMLAKLLRSYKIDGVLRRPGKPTKDDLQATLDRAFDRLVRPSS